MPTKTIQINSTVPRILLVIVGLTCLIFVFFASKWFLGNSVSSRVIQKEVADFAITLAPSDPQTHYAKGVLLEKSFQPDDLPKSLAEYEQAVALSPNDYRLWVAFGKAKERNGDSEGAEKALQKALELAPNYAEVQWVYGNILLRQGKNKDAFAMIRKAVEGDPNFAGPAATTAWDIFEGDIEEIKNTIGDSSSVKSALATFLAGQKRFSESLEIWNALPAEARKTTFRKDGESILTKLLAEKKYRSAVPLINLLDEEKTGEITVGKITNGGFEEIIAPENQKIFQWQIAKGNKPLVGPNKEQKHSGDNSLVIVFKSPTGKDFRQVSQTVAVRADENYEFEIFYRSNLDTSATLKWEIADSQSGKILATTASTEAKTDWQSLSASFQTTETSEGVVIRLVREKCTSADCSISGTVWFDDVSLK